MFTRVPRFTGLALMFNAAAFTAGAASVPVTVGKYVRAGLPCADAPLAALLTYDGQNFTGAHAGNCSTTVISADGRRYALKTTCRSAGDGSPAPYAETQTVTVRSMSRFTFAHRTGADSPGLRRVPLVREGRFAGLTGDGFRRPLSPQLRKLER